ncbi:MAG TPA: hypothetical protein VIK28_07230, partial [Sedimentisphaerales bacterium]
SVNSPLESATLNDAFFQEWFVTTKSCPAGNVATGEYITRTMLSEQTVSFIFPDDIVSVTPSASL